MKKILKKLLPTRMLSAYRQFCSISSLTNRMEQLENSLNSLWVARRFEITRDELTESNYKNNFLITEAEHQIGRLINLEKIVQTIKENSISGDFVEFGVFRGLFLIWLARFREQYGLSDKKIIGLDSFQGLPVDSGGWKKGQFSNTSEELVIENLRYHLKPKERQNIEIIKGWFADDEVGRNMKASTTELSLIHPDCDLKVSAEDAFMVLEPYFKEGAGIKYILLDDWGCSPDEIPVAFENWKKTHPYISTSLIFETRLTRYYKAIC